MMLKAPTLRTVRGKASSKAFSVTRPSRASVVVRADSNNGAVPAAAAASSTGQTVTYAKIPPLVWSKDTETIRDVFAFAGSAPERVNGRVAMWAFASFAITELQSHTPVLEQFSSGWASAVLFSMTIVFASISPKLLSGTSLKELHAAATSENMKGDGIQMLLALFDGNLELWLGRIAMFGVTGLLATELIRGDALF